MSIYKDIYICIYIHIHIHIPPIPFIKVIQRGSRPWVLAFTGLAGLDLEWPCLGGSGPYSGYVYIYIHIHML